MIVKVDRPVAMLLLAIFLDAISIGMLINIISLTLIDWQTTNVMIGYVVAAGGLSVIIATPFMRHIMCYVNIAYLLIWVGGIFAACVFLLFIFQDPILWIIIRFFIGLFASFRWFGFEVWLIDMAPKRYKDIILSYYVIIFYIGCAVGLAIGAALQHNLLLNVSVLALFIMLSLPCIYAIRHCKFYLDAQKPLNLWKAFIVNPYIIMAVLTAGALYASTGLINAHLTMIGYAPSITGYIVVVFLFGPIFVLFLTPLLQRYSRRHVICCTSLLGAIVAGVGLQQGYAVINIGSIFILGIVQAFIYLGCLSMIAVRYKGGILLLMNTALVLMFEIAGLTTTPLAGYMMDIWGAWGLPFFIIGAALFSMLIILEKKSYN